MFFNSNLSNIPALSSLREVIHIRENLAYFNGDTFPYWIGPYVNPNTETGARVMAEVGRIFQSANLIREGVSRYANALVARQPAWYIKPVTQPGTPPSPDAEADPIATALEEQVQRWLDWLELQSVDQLSDQGDPLIQAVTNMLVTGRGYLRVFTPLRLQNAPDAIRRICLHAPSPASVQVIRDDDGLVERIIYQHSTGTYEEQVLDYDTGNLTITMHRGDKPPVRTVSNFGGRFTIFELRAASLLTPSVKQLQNGLNLTLTMKVRNTVQAGFIERVLLNAQPPGTWEADADGNEYFKPSSLELGAGTTTFVSGYPLHNEMGAHTGYTTPSISYRDPVSVDMFTNDVQHTRILMYHELGIGHLLSSGDGSISGVSRNTLKDDWLVQLQRYGKIISHAYNEVLLVALHQLVDSVDLASYQPVTTVRLSTGKPLPEEQTANLQNYGAGLISRTTAMLNVGVEDPDAEFELIKREREADVAAGLVMQPPGDPYATGSGTQPSSAAVDGNVTGDEGAGKPTATTDNQVTM